MGIGERIPVWNRLAGYEQVSVAGVLLTVLGSTMGWINVQASAEAASQLDNIEAGTAAFTGLDVNFGEITIILAVLALVVLGIVLWRYHSAGRKTGLTIMLLGILTAGVGGVGFVLAWSSIAGAGELQGVSVGIGAGILVTLIGALAMLSGGVLRLAAGSPQGGGS